MSAPPPWSAPSAPAASSWVRTGDTALGATVEEADRYVPVGLVGSGGMGVVEVVHDRRLGRDVARKLPAPDLEVGLALAVLDHEARITARLDHPNVVPVHDAGELADGRRFFTMRLVRGQTFADVLAADRARPDALPALIRALLDACRGVAHAHALGVVHADLKPANLLVGAQGETQVVDWGLADAPAAGLPAPPWARGAGTPPWRAPEVEAGAEPDPRADVYALGVVLREILSGDAHRAPDDGPPELLAVLRRATATDPGLRYPTADALADELTRWLDGRPVAAHAYTAREVIGRWASTHRLPLAVGAVALLALAVVAGAAAERTAAERDRAVVAEAEQRRTSARLWEARAADALRDDDAPTAIEAAHAADALAPSPAAVAVLRALGGPPVATRTSARPLACDAILRADAPGLVCTVGDALVAYDGAGEVAGRWPVQATDAAWRADGTLDVIVARRWSSLDPRTGAVTPRAHALWERGLVPGPAPLGTDRLALIDPARGPATTCGEGDSIAATTGLPDGRWWAVCARGRISQGDGASVRTLAGDDRALVGVVAAEASPDGAWLVLGTQHGTLLTVDVRAGRVRHEVATPLASVFEVSVAPDGVHALARDANGHVWLWRPDDGVSLGRLDVDGVRAVGWDDARTPWLLTRTRESWALAEAPAPAWWTEPDGITALAVSADGRSVAAGAGPRVVVRALPGGEPLASVARGRTVKGVTFVGDQLLSGSVDADRGLAWIRVGADEPDVLPGRNVGVRALLGPVPSGALFVVGYGTYGEVVREDGSRTVVELGQPIADASGDAVGGAWLLDVTGRLLRVDVATATVTEVARLPGATMFTVSADARRALVREGDDVVVRTLPDLAVHARWTPERRVSVLAFDTSTDGIAVGRIDGTVELRDGDGALLAAVQAHEARVGALLPLSDGGWLSGGWDGRVRRWWPAAR